MKAGPAAIVLSVCLLLHALWAALEPITAADLWWTMAAGRWIAAHGTVPAVDVFSYTFAGAPWFNQEWLSQVAFYELYRVAGGSATARTPKISTARSLPLASRSRCGRTSRDPWPASRREETPPVR